MMSGQDDRKSAFDSGGEGSSERRAPGPEAGRIVLRPRRRVGVRLVVLALLVAFAMISGPSLGTLLGFVLVTALFLGTYPDTFVGPAEVENRWRVLFLPVHSARWPVGSCIRIETDVEDHMAPEWAILIGVESWFWCQLMDRLVPWLGGDYKLWLRTDRDKRLLVWQGNGEANFRANLEILESTTGLPVTRG